MDTTPQKFTPIPRENGPQESAMSTVEAKPALTSRQKQIYDFLKDKIRNRGYGPTVREIGSHFGIRSPNGVMCHLKALERKGLITRESHMSRAIQLAESPLSRSSLPLAGQIAAGSPVLAVEQQERVDFCNLFEPEDHFCLKVRGDSMIEDQIASGDYVVVRKQDSCREGEIVVALVDGDEATLKRFYRERDRVRLEPANSAMKPIYSNNVKVLGVVVGVVRQYE
jgi:repressor LexA